MFFILLRHPSESRDPGDLLISSPGFPAFARMTVARMRQIARIVVVGITYSGRIS